MIYRFGGFEVDPERYRLTRDGEPIEIEPKVFELLCHLLAASGRTVTKEELVAAVWDGRFVSDAAVARAVQKARRALDGGDPPRPDSGRSGGSARWIETVHGRGYRVSVDVERSERAESEATTEPSPLGDASRSRPYGAGGLTSTELEGAVDTIRPAAVVLPLRNLGPARESDWVGLALGELLAFELAADGGARVVPFERVAEVARDLPSLLAGVDLDRSTLAAVFALWGAGFVVTGSYLPPSAPSGALRLNVVLREVSSGASGATVVEDASAEDLAALATRLAGRLRPGIGGRVSAAEPRAWRLLPPSPAAARLYTEGVALLRRGEATAARPLLEDAAAQAPAFALAHAALASALRELGYEQKSREAAARANRLAGTLPREHRLLVEGLHQECERDWQAAALSYSALSRFFPDDLEYGLLLTRAQLAATQSGAAAATVSALRSLPPPAGDDPRLDLAEAAVATARSDAARARELAALAVRKAAARGARRLEAQAHFEEGRSWRYLGDSVRANVSTRRAEELYAAAGDRNGVAAALQYRGATTFHLGQRDEAETLVRRALDLYTELGRPGAASVCRMNLGMLRQDRGEGVTAAGLYEQSRAVFRELGDREFSGQVLQALVNVRYSQGDMEECLRLSTEGLVAARAAGHRLNEAEFETRVGEALYMRGRLPEAADALARALALFRDLEYSVGEASALTALGSVRNKQGELAEAARLHLEALALCRRLGDAYRTADALNRAGNDRYAQGQLKQALELHRDALAAYESIGHRFGVGVASYGIAADLLGRGSPAEAEPLYRTALEVYQGLGNRMYTAEALRGLAEVQIARGDLAAARHGLAEAREHLRAQPEAEIERNVRLLEARIDLEQGSAADAELELRHFIAAPDLFLDGDSEAAARDLLAQSLLAQGRFEEARPASRRALALTERTQRNQLRLGIEITAARIAAALGEVAEAAAALAAVADRAGELDLVSRRLEAELALAEMRLGERGRGRDGLLAVARQAESQGLGLLARKAALARV